MKKARVIEFLIGLVFLFAAAAKALDLNVFAVQISSYGVIQDPATVSLVAYVTVAIEAILGALLVSGIRLGGAAVGAAALLLAGFTALVAYAWATKGLADCGCFGKYITTGPGTTIAKNLIMLALLGMGSVSRWKAQKRNLPSAPSKRAAAICKTVAVAGLVVVATAMALGTKPQIAEAPPEAKEKPFVVFNFTFEDQPYDLGAGEYLVAFLSADCDHCRASVKVLNEVAADPASPQIAGIVLGDEAKYAAFETETFPLFPTARTEEAVRFSLLSGCAAPPAFHFVRDGVSVKSSCAQNPVLADLTALYAEGGTQEANG